KADAERRRQKSVRWWWDDDAGMLHLQGRLPDVQGQRLVTALERAASQAPADPATGIYDPYEARCADALCDLAGQRLAADPNGGPTDLDNLTLLCGHHHRWLHQQGGRIPKVIPPRLRPEVRDRLLENGRRSALRLVN